MRDERALALFREILRKTEGGTFPWQPTPEEDVFVAPMLGKYTLTLRPFTDKDQWGNPEGPPSLVMQDNRGNTLVEITRDIDEVTTPELRTLAVFARRIALQADEKIDEVLAELKKDEIKKDEDIPF